MKHIGKIIWRTVLISGVLLMIIVLSHYALGFIITALSMINIWVNQILEFIRDEKNFLETILIILLFSVALEFVGRSVIRCYKAIKAKIRKWVRFLSKTLGVATDCCHSFNLIGKFFSFSTNKSFANFE